jgi:hypothetical protein
MDFLEVVTVKVQIDFSRRDRFVAQAFLAPPSNLPHLLSNVSQMNAGMYEDSRSY